MRRISLALAVCALLLSPTLSAQQSTSSLWTWAATGQVAAVRDLLARPRPDVIDAQDEMGWTALMHAASAGHDMVARILLEKGANLALRNTIGETALHLAARRGRADVVRRLLTAGADIAARDTEGRTSLFKAIEGAQAEVIAILHQAAQARAANDSPIRAITPEAGTLPPTLVQWSDAPYPDEALSRRVEGTVVLVALVRADGTVGALSISRGLDAALDQSALRTVRDWKFEPATRADKPVAVVVEVSVEFKLPAR